MVRDLTVMNRGGEIRTVAADYCGFGYRDSYLKVSREIVISARFCLRMGDRGLISREIDRILAIRGAKFPPDGRTAGCFFKNIPDPSQPFGKLPAGKLLDEVGAKTLHVGGAKVYEKHANIIVNTGTASSKDISDLADILKKKVLQKFGIMLEEEVIRIGSFPT
ncbi:MAG: hypothetical protein HY770_04440 [Chitinivibrionia bacterium]|nr:hypothetical protein [Chitinivibrionia bacterium]